MRLSSSAAVSVMRAAAAAAVVVMASVEAQTDETPVDEPELESGIEAGRRDASPPVLTLPAWTIEDQREFRAGRPVNLGGGLWPKEHFPLQPVARRPKAPTEVTESPPLPDNVSERLVPPGPLSAALVAKYFAQRPEAWVLDPQRLLPAGRWRELDRFLEQQAADGRFHVHLLVFSAAQELPAHLSLERFHQEWFAEAPDVVLAAFFLGEPRRATLVFPTGLRNASAEGSTDAILQSAIASAQRSPYPTTQLDDFLLCVSVGLFDLEKSGGLTAPGAMVAATPAPRPDRSSRWLWLGMGATALGAVALTGAILWWRRRSLDGPFHFPDREIIARLGAPHSGGAGIVLSWHEPAPARSRRRRGR